MLPQKAHAFSLTRAKAENIVYIAPKYEQKRLISKENEPPDMMIVENG